MTANEGVGKKIVEALKKQTNSDLDLTADLVEVQTEDEKENAIQQEPVFESSPMETLFGETAEKETPSDDEKFEIQEEISQPVFQETFTVEPYNTQQTVNQQSFGWNFEQPKQEFQQTFATQQQNINEISQARQFEMPPNVSVLKRLIAQLPSGVSKQTGAQIIKQTMEALGISMNTVLHEAQKVQDDMNESIKNCMLTIQEYKNNIKNLEKQGLDYQRQVNQLNDLISLFILTDKN